MHKYLFATLLLSGNLSASPACDWTSVNQNQNNTRSSPAGCTTITFDDVKNGLVVPQWSASGTSVQAAPIVSNGVVYYGDSNNALTHAPGHFYARSTATGALVQPIFTFPNADETVNGPATLVGNVIYVTTVSPTGLFLYAFDLTLTLIPSFGTGGVVNVDPGFTSVEGNILAGPVVINNLVIVATTNSTPEETTTLNPVYRGGLQAFNTTNGSLVWRTRISPPGSGFGTSGGAWSTAAVDTSLGLMFVGTTNATTPPASPLTDALLAINYSTGEVVWSRQYTANDVYSFQYACGFDYDNGASPNLFFIGNKAVVGAGSKAGCYKVFERATGIPVWCQSMMGEDSIASIDGNPSAAYANGRVYTITNTDTSGIAYNAFSVLAQYGLKLGDPTPIIQLLVYLGTTDLTFIKSLDARNGNVKWTNISTSASLGAITEANGVLYTGNFLGNFRALNTQTGEAFTIATLGGTIGAPITVVNNQIFIGLNISGAGGLFVYNKP